MAGKGKHDKALAERLTRKIAAKLLVRAYMNAAALYDAAKTLVDCGHFGFARSLAISAREEMGKGFMVGSFLAGQIDAVELVETLRSHKYKQAEGLIPPMLVNGLMESPELLAVLIPDAGITPAELFATLPGRLMAQNESVFGHLGPLLEPLRAMREMAADGVHERERQAGIYASLELDDDGIRIEHPQQVTAEQAEAEIARVGLLLTSLAGLTGRLPAELWTDDESAERFAVMAETLLRPGMFNPGPAAP